MENHHEKNAPSDRGKGNGLPRSVRLLFFLIGVTCFILVDIYVRPQQESGHGDSQFELTSNLGLVTGILEDKFPCGRDGATAMDRGCSFESYTATWQPPQCFDAALDTEFRNTKPWKFYTDRNASAEVSWGAVEKGIFPQVWTTWEFHLHSCAFIWKKEVKIAHGIVSGTIDYHQCLDHALMQDYATPLDHVSVPFWPRFTSCRPPSDISVHQFDLKPTKNKKVTEVHEHSHLHGSNKEFDHRAW